MGACPSCCSHQEVNTHELLPYQQEVNTHELFPSQEVNPHKLLPELHLYQETYQQEVDTHELFPSHQKVNPQKFLPSQQEVNAHELLPHLGDNEICNLEEFGNEEEFGQCLKASYDIGLLEDLDLLEPEQIPTAAKQEEASQKQKFTQKGVPLKDKFLKEKESMKIEEVEQLFKNLNYSMLNTAEIARKFHAAKNMKTLKKISAELKKDCHDALDDAQKLLLKDNYKEAKLSFAYAYQMRCCCDWIWVNVLKKQGNKGHAEFLKNSRSFAKLAKKIEKGERGYLTTIEKEDIKKNIIMIHNIDTTDVTIKA